MPRARPGRFPEAMTPTGFGPAPVPYLPAQHPGTDRGGHDAYAWIVPVVVSALLALLVPPALLFGALSPMATDACGPDHCSAGLTRSLATVEALLRYGGLVTVPAYVASWVLPWRRSWTPVRVVLGAAALLPPVAVLGLVLTLPAG